MDLSPLDLIQMNGAEARADGVHRMMNPYFLRANSPPESKETVAEWRAKKEAWDRGYREGYPFIPAAEDQGNENGGSLAGPDSAELDPNVELTPEQTNQGEPHYGKSGDEHTLEGR